MRPTVRRIDLTHTPTRVEVWPSLDWLETTGEPDSGSTRVTSTTRAPHGRRGLWDAMAQAVQRAREASSGPSAEVDGEQTGGADVIEFAPTAPHLAYLARVACGRASTRGDVPGADVIAMVDARAEDCA